MRLPFRRHTEHRTRGQAMVEFALVLPVLILLLVLAIDFGRVFFGWVALNNAARIAASEAGWQPQAWEDGDTFLQNVYRRQVLDDLESINCAAPGGSAWTTADIPDPTFLDQPGTFSSNEYELGDHTVVTLTCEFDFLTPLAGAIVGDPMVITASAEFPVKGAEVAGLPVGPVAPTPPATCTDEIVPNLVGQSVAAARAAWSASFSGAFSPASGSDTETVTGQTTSPPSIPGDCLEATATVTVTHEVQCSMPQLVGVKSSVGGGAFSSAGFTGTYTINRPPSNDYVIGSQSLVGGQVYPCSSSVTVFK